MRGAGVAVTAAVMVVLTASSSAATSGGETIFVEPSWGGGYRAGSLTLRGVGQSVAWFRDQPAAATGRIPLSWLRDRLWSPGSPAPTGALSVNGSSGRTVTAVRLFGLRYRAQRKTVVYRARRIGGGRLSRSFGPATLSIIGEASGGAPKLGSSFGNTCSTTFVDATGFSVQTVSSSKWPTDDWNPALPSDFGMGSGDSWRWQSDGGAFRGCSNTAVWQIYGGASGTVTFQTTDPWTGANTVTCTSSNPGFGCLQVSLSGGRVIWSVGPTPPGSA